MYEDPRASADVSVTLCFSDLFPGVRVPGTYALRGKLRYSWPLLPLLPPQPVQLDAHTGKTLFLSSKQVLALTTPKSKIKIVSKCNQPHVVSNQYDIL